MQKKTKGKIPSGPTGSNPEYATQRLLRKIERDSDNFYKQNRSTSVHGGKKTIIEDGGIRKKGYIKKPVRGKPLISVITTVFNGVDSIERTIRSVIQQTYDNLEYIIIDGGSTDGTLGVIRKYNDVINYWISRKDRGIYEGMNHGIMMSNGEWINFMNSGDTFTSADIIECAAEVFKKSHASFIYSDAILVYEKGQRERIHYCYKTDKKTRLLHQSCIYKKELHDLYGYYLVADGVTISDYIFFNQLPQELFLKFTKMICRFDKNNNISSGWRHFNQKLGSDMIFGICGSTGAVIKIVFFMFESIYKSIKRLV